MTEEIKVTKQKYPDTIRESIGMYLGGTEYYTTPLREIINNSVDELLNGHCNTIDIVNTDSYKMVIDNGRGLPIYIDDEYGDRTITHALITESHVGSKFGVTTEKSGGLHGIGSKAVNAISDRYITIVKMTDTNRKSTVPGIRELAANHKDAWYYLEYNKGIFVLETVCSSVEEINSLLKIEDKLPKDFSTLCFMIPDTTLYTRSIARVSELPLKLARLENPKSTIRVDGKSLEDFNYVKDITEGVTLFENKHVDFKYMTESNDLELTVYISFCQDTFDYKHHSTINLIETPHGGFIERLARTALAAAIAEHSGILKPRDVDRGLNLFSVAYSAAKMSFSSQTKEKLVKLEGLQDSTRDIERNLKNFILKTVIKANRSYFDLAIQRLIEYKNKMNQLSNMDFVKSVITFGDDNERVRQSKVDAARIYEAKSKNWMARELYITEGLSASGNIIKFRDLQLQSVLPLKGKLLNTSAMTLEDILNNPEVLAIINTLGIGAGSITDITRTRYGKGIIATDLDPDGDHIANLIAALFIQHAPEFVEAGMLYKLEAPFYMVTTGKEVKYYYANEKDQIDFAKSKVERLKGLGSYSPEEVKEFMINPKTRKLVQIVANDLSEITDAISLLYSGTARKALMIERGVLSE